MLKPTFLPEVVKLKVDDATVRGRSCAAVAAVVGLTVNWRVSAEQHRSVDVARKLISSNKEVATMRGNHNYPQVMHLARVQVCAGLTSARVFPGHPVSRALGDRIHERLPVRGRGRGGGDAVPSGGWR